VFKTKNRISLKFIPMSYLIVNTTILQQEAAGSAAEVHGIASALLCLDATSGAGDWMNEAISRDADLLEDDKLLLINLFEHTQTLLESDEFLFDLFLPEEEQAIEDRAIALTQWCEGFLFGIGRIQSNSQWHEEIDEILKDMVELTKMDTGLEEDDEEAEAALIEIQEYLRAAVMLIYTELNGKAHITLANETVH
jgi:uncharacterized protein YgfB (UPF0149 family)